MSWQPKLRPKGFPHGIDDFAVASLSELEYRSRTGDEKRDQRVFRVKRKHVLKACDRCRVKKTKVGTFATPRENVMSLMRFASAMGNSPATAARYTTTRVFFASARPLRPRCTPEGKFSILRAYSVVAVLVPRLIPVNAIRFVEMLESHHSLVVKALQKLYKFCINNEGFPGEPLAEAPDGHPLTHAILDRLGLIKQAEENADEPDEDSEDLRYLQLLSTSTECSATAEPSPEPATPPEPSPTTMSRPSVSSSLPTPLTTRNPPSWQWDMPSAQASNYNFPDAGYQTMMPMPPRSSINSVDLSPNELPPHVELSAGSSVAQAHSHDPSYAYYLDGSCNGDGQADTKPARLSTGIMPDHPHQMGPVSSDMLSEFHFQTQESPFYPGFTPGWTFPSG